MSLGERPYQLWESVYAPREAVKDRWKAITIRKEVVGTAVLCRRRSGRQMLFECAVTRGMFKF